MSVDDLIKILSCGDASHDEQQQAADLIGRARQETLEEAAELAEFRYEHWNHTKGHGVSCDVTACEEIARAIRALKDS